MFTALGFVSTNAYELTLEERDRNFGDSRKRDNPARRLLDSICNGMIVRLILEVLEVVVH